MTDRIDTGTIRVKGGYFLYKDGQAARQPFAGADDSAQIGEYRHCFTYSGSRPAIHQALLDMIHKARKKVFITSFRIGDPDLLNALYEAVERLRGGVYVITALDEASLARGLAELDDEAGADIQAQSKRFEELTSRGIYVRGHSSCHAKFVVVDDTMALVSSANLETRAFFETGESGVIVQDRDEVNRLGRFFTRLWHAGCDWEVPPGQAYTVRQRKPGTCPCQVPLPVVGPQSRVIWTCQEEHFILSTIHDIIEKAKRNLVLATFSLCGISDYPELLLEPLKRAVRDRGVDVRLLVRARNIRGQRCDAEALVRLGVHIDGDSRNHAKGVFADGRHGALFSANFDSKHGLLQGVEVGVRLDGLPSLAEALRYFEHAVRHADRRFVTDPTQREMDESLVARWRKRWPLGPTVRIRPSSPKTWDLMASGIQEGPVLYLRREPEIIQLYAGRGQWRILGPEQNGVMRLEMTEEPGARVTHSTESLLEEWLEGKLDDAERGFCSAILERIGS